MYSLRKKCSSLPRRSNFTPTSLLAGSSSASSQVWGSEPYFEGEISDVRVTWARKRCGEFNCLLVSSMSVGRIAFKGWFAGGSSQRDEPGIFEIFLAVYLGGQCQVKLHRIITWSSVRLLVANATWLVPRMIAGWHLTFALACESPTSHPTCSIPRDE
jgi:hypothetical protein